jgi:hypothetical protein
MGKDSEPDLRDRPILPYLPDALRAPSTGRDVLERLVGAEIVAIGTTDPGVVEGGGLLIDYRRPGEPLQRLVLGFSERGMWVEDQTTFAS